MTFSTPSHRLSDRIHTLVGIKCQQAFCPTQYMNDGGRTGTEMPCYTLAWFVWDGWVSQCSISSGRVLSSGGWAGGSFPPKHPNFSPKHSSFPLVSVARMLIVYLTSPSFPPKPKILDRTLSGYICTLFSGLSLCVLPTVSD